MAEKREQGIQEAGEGAVDIGEECVGEDVGAKMECAVWRTEAFVILSVGDRDIVGCYHENRLLVCIPSQ